MTAFSESVCQRIKAGWDKGDSPLVAILFALHSGNCDENHHTGTLAERSGFRGQGSKRSRVGNGKSYTWWGCGSGVRALCEATIVSFWGAGDGLVRWDRGKGKSGLF